MIPERSRVLVTTGTTIAADPATGLLRSSGSVYYLQPNGSLVPRQPSGLVLRRWVEFPRRGPLPAIPLDTIDAATLALYPDGPPILAEDMIPLSAGWLSPAKALFFTSLGVAGFAAWRYGRPKV